MAAAPHRPTDMNSIKEVDDTAFSVNEYGSLILGHQPHHSVEVRNPYLNYLQHDDDNELYNVVDTTRGRLHLNTKEMRVSAAEGLFTRPDTLERALVLFEPGAPSQDPLCAELRRRMLEAQEILKKEHGVHIWLMSCDVSRYPTAVLKMRRFPGGAPTHLPILHYFADRVVVFPPLFWTNTETVKELPTPDSITADVVRARRSCRMHIF